MGFTDLLACLLSSSTGRSTRMAQSLTLASGEGATKNAHEYRSFSGLTTLVPIAYPCIKFRAVCFTARAVTSRQAHTAAMRNAHLSCVSAHPEAHPTAAQVTRCGHSPVSSGFECAVGPDVQVIRKVHDEGVGHRLDVFPLSCTRMFVLQRVSQEDAAKFVAA